MNTHAYQGNPALVVVNFLVEILFNYTFWLDLRMLMALKPTLTISYVP